MCLWLIQPMCFRYFLLGCLVDHVLYGWTCHQCIWLTALGHVILNCRTAPSYLNATQFFYSWLPGDRNRKRLFGTALENTENCVTRSKIPMSFKGVSPSRILSRSGSLSLDQRRVMDVVMAGQNVFFTGCAGSGKTFLLKRIIGGPLCWVDEPSSVRELLPHESLPSTRSMHGSLGLCALRRSAWIWRVG